MKPHALLKADLDGIERRVWSFFFFYLLDGCNWMKGHSHSHQLMIIREMLEIQTGCEGFLKSNRFLENTCFFLEAEAFGFKIRELNFVIANVFVLYYTLTL